MEEEKKLLKKYYELMNERKIENIINLFHDNIKVIHKEEEKNWEGKETAKEKLTEMYKNIPNYKCEILEMESFQDESKIIAKCYFGHNEDVNFKLENSKLMTYHFNSSLISKIEIN
jgi:hypothetical protein